MTMLSKIDEDHKEHLKNTFVKWKKLGLSLNPNKSHISMKEWKLLGYIISKQVGRIYSKRVEEIKQIDLPRNKKQVQSFLGKVIFSGDSSQILLK